MYPLAMFLLQMSSDAYVLLVLQSIIMTYKVPTRYSEKNLITMTYNIFIIHLTVNIVKNYRVIN